MVSEMPWDRFVLIQKKCSPQKRKKKSETERVEEMKNQIEIQAQNHPVDGQAIFVSSVAWI